MPNQTPLAIVKPTQQKKKNQLQTKRAQTPEWIEYGDHQVAKLLGHYTGSREEQTAQAVVDLLDKQVYKQQLNNQLIGGFLLYVKVKRLYKALNYDSMEQFITSEKVGGLGRTQCYKLMKVAQYTRPPNTLTAPALTAPVLNPQSGRLLMTPDFVTQIGHERAYALTQKWEGETPEGRKELLDAAVQADNQGFYKRAYGDEDGANFEVQGDDIFLWQDAVGTRVAHLVTLDPVLRSILLDRLQTIPRAKL